MNVSAEKKTDDDLEIHAEVEDDDQLELEIVDDTPPADRGKPRSIEDVDDDDPDEDEIESYSARVQKRLSKMTRDKNTLRRISEEAKREAAEAIEAARRVHEELKKYRKMVEDGETVLAEQAGGRVTAELARAKEEYKKAYEEGDADKLVEASAKIAELQNEGYRVRSFSEQIKNRPKPKDEPVIPARPKIPQLSELQQQWLSENEWFNKDPEMTGYAYGVSQKIVNLGVNPESKEYYRQIDESMRKVFPEKFEKAGDAPQRQKVSVVTPASRTAKTPRKVTLTASMVKVAKKLGLTNEQYAKQLLADRQKESEA